MIFGFIFRFGFFGGFEFFGSSFFFFYFFEVEVDEILYYLGLQEIYGGQIVYFEIKIKIFYNLGF